MKKGFLKITAVLMVAILLASSLALEKHFCGEKLKEIAFNSEAKSCCESNHVSDDNILMFNKKDCCKTESEFNNATPFDFNNKLKISKTNIVFITAFVNAYIHMYVSATAENNYYKKEISPTLVFNKQIKFQSFLI